MRKKSKSKKRPRERGLSRFRRTEAKRLVRAALEAGLSVARIEVDPSSGKISVIPGKALEPDESLTADDQLAQWKRRRHANQPEKSKLDTGKAG